jgi:hypothetical protein
MQPMFTVPWRPPSRAARLLRSAVGLTITFGPTAMFIYMWGPDEVRYQVNKQARWLPYLAKYAAWWLKQEGW